MIEPFKDRILIQRDESATITESGFIIPKEALRKETTGRVLAIGSTAQESLEIGQKVLIGVSDGVEVKPEYCDGLERCLFIKESEIRCIIGEQSA